MIIGATIMAKCLILKAFKLDRSDIHRKINLTNQRYNNLIFDNFARV